MNEGSFSCWFSVHLKQFKHLILIFSPFPVQSYNGFLYLCPIIIFSFLYNIPKFFEVRTQCSVSVTATQIANIAAVVTWNMASIV